MGNVLEKHKYKILLHDSHEYSQQRLDSAPHKCSIFCIGAQCPPLMRHSASRGQASGFGVRLDVGWPPAFLRLDHVLRLASQSGSMGVPKILTRNSVEQYDSDGTQARGSSHSG